MVIPALADYLGPDRTRTESEVDTYDWGVWAKPDPTGNSCSHTYGIDCVVCTWERDPQAHPAVTPPTGIKLARAQKSWSALLPIPKPPSMGYSTDAIFATAGVDISNSFSFCCRADGWLSNHPN